METNEQRKKAVRAAIQEELERFFAQVARLSEGELRAPGRAGGQNEPADGTDACWKESWTAGCVSSARLARRQGSCGHRQRLVGERPKELLSLVGQVTFVRPYYQCLEWCPKQMRAVRTVKRPMMPCGE